MGLEKISGPVDTPPSVLAATALLGTLLTLTTMGLNDVPPSTPTVVVEGNQLVDEGGRVIQLRGVNRSGTDYSCVQGYGIFDGPVDEDAVEAMMSWMVNAVRIPLNEDCWLGDDRLDPGLSGSAYREAILDYTNRLTAARTAVILDLHWTGTGNDLALSQQPMARAGRSVEFWRSVASSFRDIDGIVFDVFNEPHDVDWACWRDGCEGHAGMQDMVDAVRSAGASQPIVLSGLDWGGDLRRWLEFRPHDPMDALVAGVHLYDFKRCVDRDCWEAEIGKVAAVAPVVVTEFGDTDCNGDFSNELMRWADGVGVSYLAWTWNPWECDGGPAVVSRFDGEPTPYGEIVKMRFAARTAPPDLPTRMPPAMAI